MRMPRRLHRALIALAILCVARSAPAAPPPPPWKTECIGYYQLALPGEVEFAVVPPEFFTAAYDGGPYRYEDGVHAGFDYLPMWVTRPMSREDFAQLRVRMLQVMENERQRLHDEAAQFRGLDLREKNYEHARALKEFNLGTPDTFATQSIRGAVSYTYRGGRVYRIYAKPDVMAQEIQRIHARAPYEIPTPPGACFPYSFLADAEGQRPSIRASMRLREHPEVEIHFEDVRARDWRKDYSKAVNLTSAQAHRSFWSGDYAQRHQGVTLKGLFPYRKVLLDGREGVATFGEIKRNDGSIDYGYLAIVKGDFETTEDVPDLLLYVIRTAALAGGKTPVTEDELKDMAEAIAASIKRRR